VDIFQTAYGKFLSDFIFQLPEKEDELMVSQNTIPSKQLGDAVREIGYAMALRGICQCKTYFRLCNAEQATGNLKGSILNE
jgi:hypothetical protein